MLPEPHQGMDGRRVDHDAAGRQEMGHAGFHREKDLLEADVDLPVPGAFVELVRRRVHNGVGIVVHDIEAAEVVQHHRDQLLPVRQRRHVAVAVEGLAAGRPDLAHGGFSRSILDIGDGDTRALGSQAPRRGGADPVRGAGDDRYLICKACHAVSSPLASPWPAARRSDERSPATDRPGSDHDLRRPRRGNGLVHAHRPPPVMQHKASGSCYRSIVVTVLYGATNKP